MTQRTKEQAIEDAADSISRAISKNSGYSHNVISITLTGLSKEHGYSCANELVDKFKLTKLYGIRKHRK